MLKTNGNLKKKINYISQKYIFNFQNALNIVQDKLKENKAFAEEIKDIKNKLERKVTKEITKTNILGWKIPLIFYRLARKLLLSFPIYIFCLKQDQSF